MVAHKRDYETVTISIRKSTHDALKSLISPKTPTLMDAVRLKVEGKYPEDLKTTDGQKVRATFELEMDDLYYQEILREIETRGYSDLYPHPITIRKLWEI